MENIKTDRLILRKPKRSDAVSLLPLLNDNKVEEFTPGLSFKTIDEIKNFINYYTKLCDYKNDFCLVVQDLKTKDIVGIIDAYLYYSSDDTITISYAIKECTRGKGYMPEALKSFLLYLYNKSNAEFAEFSIRDDNSSSLKVMEKLNISPNNKQEDYIYYRLSLKEKPSF